MRIKLDLRPPDSASIVDAEVEDDDTVALDDAIEFADWRPVTPGPALDAPALTFIDGVQQIHSRIFAEIEGEPWPSPGMIASVAAGAVCPSDDDERYAFERVSRAIIVANGHQPPELTIETDSGRFGFRPLAAGDDQHALDAKLTQMRADLELDTLHRVLDARGGLIVVDGRLPPVTRTNVVGLIKTPHRIELKQPYHAEVLTALSTGQRTPVFQVTRSERTFYRWYICLRTPGAYDVAQSGLAVIEMDDTTPQAEAFRTADITAFLLPRYASSPKRDARAPQNLLPVGELENRLRRKLGDSEFLRRRLMEALKEMAA